MRKLTILVTLILLIQPTLLWAQTNSQTKQPLVFTHVTIIDATGVVAKPDMTVVIKEGRIAEISKSNKVKLPNNAQIVDATGKFLIPGLWDMHVHWTLKEYLPLFTANGVTGMRIMWGFPVHQQWRKQIADGTLLGPRLNISSTIIDGPKPIWQGSIGVGNEAQGRQAVIKSKQEGADFIKVYSLLPRDVYFGIVDKAKKQGISFAGHVPESISAAEASDAGQKSIEHLTGILLASSSDEKALRDEMLKTAITAERTASNLIRRQTNVKALNSYDKKKASALFARFKKNQTWLVPTLTVLRSTAYMDDPNFTNDSRLKYMPSSFRARWNPESDVRFKTHTAEDWANAKRLYAKYLEITGEARRAGVEILAGTDVSNPFCFPGFSLHDELVLLVKAGLTPMEALQAATRNPAKYLGQLDSLGTVEKGKIADLVLLDANPLVEISNTQKINAVVVGGKLVPKSQLDEMLANVEVIADKPSPAQKQDFLINGKWKQGSKNVIIEIFLRT